MHSETQAKKLTDDRCKDPGSPVCTPFLYHQLPLFCDIPFSPRAKGFSVTSQQTSLPFRPCFLGSKTRLSICLLGFTEITNDPRPGSYVHI
ncbi:hypothetical protein AVEN_218610-1 [Araneus ventricosus]|uniref:Uncharacterized protein n=1 Tax=Araneus ventricosus TaxID=182803 RepID=A0A4Y2SIQ5_ARAVE|nr:hypothetical protein AVEN_218610-1 [Araneus ventricosus]